jgi:exodeoxyribonuclease VII small subunit
VPNVSKSASQTGDAKDMAFEEALKKLESVVEAMESGELPLEALLAKFEEGSRLVGTCQAKLEEAELKISKLERNADGEPVARPAGESIPENE